MKNYKLRDLLSLEALLLILPILILSGALLSDFSISLMALYMLFNLKKILTDKELKLIFYFFISFYIIINLSALLSPFVSKMIL